MAVELVGEGVGAGVVALGLGLGDGVGLEPPPPPHETSMAPHASDRTSFEVCMKTPSLVRYL